MKQEKTKSKKRIVYYLVLAVCVLLLVAATVLTVYFVTGGGNEILEGPPKVDEPEPTPPDDKPQEPSNPSGSESVVRFIAPIAGVQMIEYEDIYIDASLGGICTQHRARDYEAEVGTPVYAMADGVVLEASYHDYLGDLVKVDHGDGIIVWYYFVDPTVTTGQTIKQGQQLGTVREARGFEEEENAHLHLEMTIDGEKVDPQDYIGLVYEDK